MTMINPRKIQIQDYNYPLPDERIAKYPLKQRDQSRLLVSNHGRIIDAHFHELPKYIGKGELIVFNNTKVIQARMHFRKSTGALIEVFLLEPASPTDYELMFQQTSHCAWLCMVGNLKKWKGEVLQRTFCINGKEVTLCAERKQAVGTSHWIELSWNNPDVNFAEILDSAGELPIPPYLNRSTEESDKETYQTVYSKIKGSVAAPTAGLHFTPSVLKALDEADIVRDELTLHVGAGTFKPVKSELIEGHDMHTEYISVRRDTIENIISHDGRAIAVGTTSVRTLESLYWMGVRIASAQDKNSIISLHINQWEPYDSPSTISSVEALKAIIEYMDLQQIDVLHSSTQIIIAPGYTYRIVKSLITNFHQPQSTLLLLVSALIGEHWRDIYSHALANDYRFLSYGDSSLLIP